MKNFKQFNEDADREHILIVKHRKTGAQGIVKDEKGKKKIFKNLAHARKAANEYGRDRYTGKIKYDIVYHPTVNRSN